MDLEELLLAEATAKGEGSTGVIVLYSLSRGHSVHIPYIRKNLSLCVNLQVSLV